MFSSSFDQHISVPTRVPENTATLLDHIWSNSIDRTVSEVFDASISDHHINLAYIPFRILTKTINHKFKDHSDQCIDELEKSLFDNILLSYHFNAQWEECGNYDQKFSLFFSKNLITFMIKCCQIKSRVLSIHRQRKPWLTPDIMPVTQKAWTI